MGNMLSAVADRASAVSGRDGCIIYSRCSEAWPDMESKLNLIV